MPPDTIAHATCIAWEGRGILIRGPSGSGKSTLALGLMAHGAVLVADDRVVLTRHEDQVIADAPPAIRGMIEARGLGLLNADVAGPVPVALVVEMGGEMPERLPDARKTDLSGTALPLLHGWDSPHFIAALLQYLKAGRRDDI